MQLNVITLQILWKIARPFQRPSAARISPSLYAFLLLPPFLALDPVASAVSSGDAPAAANMALRSSSVY